MTPQWGTNIERILLNFNQPFLSGYQLNLDPGVNTNIIGSNGQPSGTTWQFDIRVNEPSPQGLTFTGTLSYCHNVTLDCFDLEPTHFNALSNNLSGATPQLYALFRTAQPGTVTPGWTTSNGTEFWAGASQAPTLVPGPAPLLLLSTGLLGLSGWKAWRRIRGEGRTER
jgi:hypothetical protein